MKLNLACGFDKKAGWVNADVAAGCMPDVRMDALVVPWPFADDEAEQVLISHFMEHVPHQLPGHDRDGFFVLMDELYRVCRAGAEVEVKFPSAFSVGWASDPTHTRGLLPSTFHYCDAAWRKQFGFMHYPLSCDFMMEGQPEGFVGLAQTHLAKLLVQFTDPDERNRAAINHLIDGVAEWHIRLRAVKPSR